jgi:hypothetical protein
MGSDDSNENENSKPIGKPFGRKWFYPKKRQTSCCRMMSVLLSIDFPSWRAMDTAMPILLSEGCLNEHEMLILSRYSGHVQDLNRGLENAASCFATGDMDRLGQECKRNLLKGRYLLGKEGNENVLEAAKNIVDGKLMAWWELL